VGARHAAAVYGGDYYDGGDGDGVLRSIEHE
jgi:hypothetical protein